MKHSPLLIALIFTLGCHKPVRSDPGARLKDTMAAFLRRSTGPDSNLIHFQVIDVAFFKDKDFYECEFHVRMTSTGKDTTGMMKARITTDFATVTRKW